MHPRYGQNWPLKAPIRPGYCEEVISSGKATPELILAIHEVMKDQSVRSGACSSLEEWYPKNTIGFPQPSEYPDDLGCRQITGLERARNGLIAATCATVQILLARSFGFDHVEDIFMALKQPAVVIQATPASIYHAIREHIIIPLFGSLQTFYDELVELRAASKGYIQIFQQMEPYGGYSENVARAMFASNPGMLRMLDVQKALEPRKKDLNDTIFWAIMHDEFVPYTGKNPMTEEIDLDVVQSFFDNDHLGFYSAEDRCQILKLRSN